MSVYVQLAAEMSRRNLQVKFSPEGVEHATTAIRSIAPDLSEQDLVEALVPVVTHPATK